MKKSLTAAILLAATLVCQAASAGELTLYSREGFHGREISLQGGSNDFRALGFNDRASSLVVHSGTWELCEHVNFQGFCAVFERGEYPDLKRFDNNVSSAREVQRRHRGWERDRDESRDNRRERERDRENDNWQGGGGRQQDNGWRADPVELYDDNGLGGRRVAIGSDIRSLRDVDFNDHANGMIINQGTWELCEHANYQGKCKVYGPGRYPDLQEMSDRVSSMRRVR